MYGFQVRPHLGGSAAIRGVVLLPLSEPVPYNLFSVIIVLLPILCADRIGVLVRTFESS